VINDIVSYQLFKKIFRILNALPKIAAKIQKEKPIVKGKMIFFKN